MRGRLLVFILFFGISQNMPKGEQRVLVHCIPGTGRMVRFPSSYKNITIWHCPMTLPLAYSMNEPQNLWTAHCCLCFFPLQVKTGIVMNIIGVICITLSINSWGRAMFQLDTFPSWANGTLGKWKQSQKHSALVWTSCSSLAPIFSPQTLVNPLRSNFLSWVGADHLESIPATPKCLCCFQKNLWANISVASPAASACPAVFPGTPGTEYGFFGDETWGQKLLCLNIGRKWLQNRLNLQSSR